MLAALAGQLLAFCYPGTCAHCGAAANGPMCVDCVDELERLECLPACERCGMPAVEHGAPCARCLGEGLYPYERVLRLGTFHDPLKSLIHQLKYHRRWPVGEMLAERLYRRSAVKTLLAEVDCLVAVPLHYWRHLRRGYNQAEIIARRLARRAKRPLIQPLRRVRNTETQTHLHSKTKRVENLRDAFELLYPRQVYGRRVAVIDDVMTTGATLQSVGRALTAARPASLCALVLAVADPKHQDFQAI